MSKKNEGEIQNLDRGDSIDKMKELVKHNSVCMFATGAADTPLHTRPMSAQQVDDLGNLWFLSANDSHKNDEIAHDARVQLFFSNTSDSEFMSIYGQASISSDRQKIEEIWTPIAKAWFTEGKDDPRITAIKVEPDEAFYWDTKSGKMVSMIKILASAIAGKTFSEGVEGSLNV